MAAIWARLFHVLRPLGGPLAPFSLARVHAAHKTTDPSRFTSCGFRQPALQSYWSRHSVASGAPQGQARVLARPLALSTCRTQQEFQTATAMAALAAKPLARRSTAFGVSDVIIGTSPLGGIGTSISDAAAAYSRKCVRANQDPDTAPLYG